MIETENNKLNKLMERQPFHVPDNYFEGFTGDFMSRLPKRPVSSESKVITLYDRIKPWLYMAASFIGIMILLNIYGKDKVVVMNEESSSPEAITSSEIIFENEDEDADFFMEYMEGLYIDRTALVAMIDDYYN